MSWRRQFYLQTSAAALAWLATVGCKSTNSNVKVAGVKAPTAGVGDWETTLSGVIRIRFATWSGSAAYLRGPDGKIALLTAGHVVKGPRRSGKFASDRSAGPPKAAFFSFDRPLLKAANTDQYQVWTSYDGQGQLYDYALITFPDQSIFDEAVVVTPLELSERGVGEWDFVLYTGYGRDDSGDTGSLRFGTNYVNISDAADGPDRINSQLPVHSGRRCATSICTEYDAVTGNTVPRPHDGALTDRGDSGAPILKMEDGQLRIVGISTDGFHDQQDRAVTAAGFNIHRTWANSLPAWLATVGIALTPTGYERGGRPIRLPAAKRAAKPLLPKIKEFFRRMVAIKPPPRSVYSGSTGAVVVDGDAAADVPLGIELGGLVATDVQGAEAADAGSADAGSANPDGDAADADPAAKPASADSSSGQGGARPAEHGR